MFQKVPILKLFISKLKEFKCDLGKVTLLSAVCFVSDYLLYLTGKKHRVVLLMDETIQSGSLDKVLTISGEAMDIINGGRYYSNARSFDVIFSSLRYDLVRGLASSSGRKLSIIPLPMLVNPFSLFSKYKEGQQYLNALIAQTGGHPRTLEFLFKVLENYGHRGIEIILHELTEEVKDKYEGLVRAEICIPVIISEKVPLSSKPANCEETYDELIESGVYTESVSVGDFVPQMPLIFLRVFAELNREKFPWVRHLNLLLFSNGDPRTFSGLTNDDFHFHWEVMMRELMAGKSLTVSQFYRGSKLLFGKDWVNAK